MRIAYFDCFAGISGDMTLGALVDAGVDFDALKRELDKLAVDDYEIKLDRVVQYGISASDVTVRLTGRHHHARSFSDIKRIIEESSLSESIKARAVSIFRRLGEAEANVHGTSLDEIHFHEVGAVDAIVDIVGVCICLEMLGVEKVYSSPMPTFHGCVEIAHGVFPLPAPATAELLKNVPWRTMGIEGELVTPTGAAIISELAEDFGPMPPMITRSIGYGAGKRDYGIPNVLRVLIGDTTDSGGEHDEVAVLETNIDDLSPQVYEVVMERLFAAGALDVYLTPIQMKKNRPATLLSVMCAPDAVGSMSDIIFEETSTIGIRLDTRKRMCLPREVVTVETKYGPINVKVARRGGEPINVQPEYEDCKAAAAKHAVPVKAVRDAAVVAFYQHA
ncbi:MAG: nickel pincer cofactor biosynthesis protein LarC [Armatimonadetes bacterium]|nr:nickel pincer cofactor biosynthesis protein LarC [Armatimonadota bacterium]